MQAPNSWGVQIFWHGNIPAILAQDVVAFADHGEALRFFLVARLRFFATAPVPIGTTPVRRPMVIDGNALARACGDDPPPPPAKE